MFITRSNELRVLTTDVVMDWLNTLNDDFLSMKLRPDYIQGGSNMTGHTVTCLHTNRPGHI